MKLVLPFLFASLAVDAFEIVAPKSSLDAWAHQADLQRDEGITKELKTRSSTRIIGGSDAPAGRYPYYTYVELTTGDDEVFICSATLIWEDMLLSAAHCVLDILGTGATFKKVEAFVGLESQDLRDDAHFSAVERSLPHPNYTVGTEENDILLFKLVTPSTITPVRLNFDPAVPADGTTVDAFGFGVTSTDTDPVLPTILQTVSVSVVPIAECNDANSFNGAINATVMMCAGVPEGGKVNIHTISS